MDKSSLCLIYVIWMKIDNFFFNCWTFSRFRILHLVLRNITFTELDHFNKSVIQLNLLYVSHISNFRINLEMFEMQAKFFLLMNIIFQRFLNENFCGKTFFFVFVCMCG